MAKFEVGKTYKTVSGRAAATVLKRLNKTLIVRWSNGYFGGQKRVKFRFDDSDNGFEYFYVHHYQSTYAFFADNAE